MVAYVVRTFNSNAVLTNTTIGVATSHKGIQDILNGYGYGYYSLQKLVFLQLSPQKAKELERQNEVHLSFKDSDKHGIYIQKFSCND